MGKYTVKGRRFVREYTEKGTSPVYAAAVQAQKIVDTFCDVPWKRTGVDDSIMTYHTDEIVDEERHLSGYSKNVEIRDSFDAALFCADHKSGMHRAYANAAVYRYTLPDDAIGTTLTSLSARVTSDPYNSEGARLHIFTNSTGEIPMNCRVLRGESAAGEIINDGTTVSAVAKRTEKLVGKETYWYPTTETCTLTPTSMTLQKYLFVLVALESYSTVRGNWLEGCSFISNAVEIETAESIGSLSSTEINDLRYSPEESPEEINLRIVANADLKGKLFIQAVSYRTRRILKKWIFDCEFFYGQNEMTVTIPNVSGTEELLSHYGGIFFEAWVGGEKYESSNHYGCSNLRDDFTIELTPMSPIFSRISLVDGRSDRKTNWGTDSGDVEDTDESIVKELTGGRFNHVRIIPYEIAGSPYDREEGIFKESAFTKVTNVTEKRRVIAEFDVNIDERPYITEADFLRDGQLDIDWDLCESELILNSIVSGRVGDVSAIRYRIVLGKDGPISKNSPSDTNTIVRAFSTLVERRFEPYNYRTTTKDHAIKVGQPIHRKRPTFLWRLEKTTKVDSELASDEIYGCSYTAFQIQVYSTDTNALVYDSGIRRAPVRDHNGAFTWESPVDLERGNYKWRVTMYNAKFKPTDEEEYNGWSEFMTFSIEE